MTPLFRLVKFLRPYRGYLAVTALAALAQMAADLAQPWPLKFIFDNIFKNNPLPAPIAKLTAATFGDSETGILYFALFGVLAIAVVGSAASFVQGFFMPRIGHWIMHDLRRQLYWHIQRLSLAYHDERRLGDLMGTLTGDIQAVREFIESAALGMVVNAVVLAGMIAIILAIDWRFALLALSVAPALFAIVYHLTRRAKQASRDVRRHEGRVASIAHEVLSSIRVVQAFTRESYEQERFERENLERVSAGIYARTLQARLAPTVELLVACGTVLVLWYGSRQVLAGTLMPGSLLVFLAYLGRLYKPMRDLSKQSDTVNRALVGAERIFGVLENERVVKESPSARPAPKVTGKIAFKEVSFAYRPGQPVLRDLSFRVEPGEVMALVGPTGAGKTTLVGLIPRFNDPTHGSILIDGRDICSYTLGSLRAQISLVLQETVLFYGTMRDNIAYGRTDASDEEIVAAAKEANAHEFITRLPDGYETIIGEHGATLSGGQRQRLAIARAIIRDAPIILLDEPTTGLDAASEALVMEALARLIASRTVIIIAHRLSTISRANKILMLERGQIVESGSHDKLLAAGGRYAELYELQLRGQSAMKLANQLT
jgi:ATP-binding cassette, subfamily B, bacterial